MQKDVHAFGHWPSSISAASVAGSGLRFGRVQVAGDAVYWSEGRPAEKGRATIMRWTAPSSLDELIPAPYSARSRVHEYGGGEFLIADDTLYFVNDSDQDVYAAGASDASLPIRRLTSIADTRFADFIADTRRNRLIAVGETHKTAGLPDNALWSLPAHEGASAPFALLYGRDFYASPRLSPCGERLAFLAWDLPHMPWDAAQLYIVDIGVDGLASIPVAVPGRSEGAFFQPEWDADGTLYYVSDEGGQGNLYRWRQGAESEQLTRLDGDLSLPLWTFNAASYAFLPGGGIYLNYIDRGAVKAAVLDSRERYLKPHRNGLTSVATLAAGKAGVALAGIRSDEGLAIHLDAAIPGNPHSPALLRKSGSGAFDHAYISEPARIAIPSDSGETYGLFYPPANPRVDGPAVKKPPLIISLHGGPTGAAANGLKPRTLFFTSRGFSWLDLDYSGSTGYGRPYRDRLNGNWGIADVADTINAAKFAGAEGLADERAIFVTGGSAGGYTVLMAILASGVFRGAASYYGICDLVALQHTTHKFEQGYQSTLLGASLDTNEALYRERSAITHFAAMQTPLILFQGADDQVVPKQQSLMIAEALREKGITVEYNEFAGEGHGFRRADTISFCLERELLFYQMLLDERLK